MFGSLVPQKTFPKSLGVGGVGWDGGMYER